MLMSEILITCFCSGDWEDMPEEVRNCRWRNIAGVSDFENNPMGNEAWGLTVYTCDNPGKADCEEGVCPIPEIDSLVNS